MSDGKFSVDGTVTKCERGRFFRVKLDGGNTILATLSGKMHMKHIKVLTDDRVEVELDGYDLTKGIIRYRHK